MAAHATAPRNRSVFWYIIAMAVGVGLIIAVTLVLSERDSYTVVPGDDTLQGSGTDPDGFADVADTAEGEDAATGEIVEMGAGAAIAEEEGSTADDGGTPDLEISGAVDAEDQPELDPAVADDNN